MIDQCSCGKGFIWNSSNCECECDKSCKIREYLDYENCKCRKKLVDKLVKECTKNVDEKKNLSSKIAFRRNNSSCMQFLHNSHHTFSLNFTINIGIATYFIYCKYINHDKKSSC